jgi:hypothetical protein
MESLIVTSRIMLLAKSEERYCTHPLTGSLAILGQAGICAV